MLMLCCAIAQTKNTNAHSMTNFFMAPPDGM